MIDLVKKWLKERANSSNRQSFFVSVNLINIHGSLILIAIVFLLLLLLFYVIIGSLLTRGSFLILVDVVFNVFSLILGSRGMRFFISNFNRGFNLCFAIIALARVIIFIYILLTLLDTLSDTWAILLIVLTVHHCSRVVRRRINIRISQQRLNRCQNAAHIVDWLPSMLQNVQTDASIGVNIRVEHLG